MDGWVGSLGLVEYRAYYGANNKIPERHFVPGQYVYWDFVSFFHWDNMCVGTICRTGPEQNIVKKGDKVSQKTYCPGTKCVLGHFVAGQNVWELGMQLH